ncbi:MAG: DNA primase [Ectothiorhodospiraceae bacterium]|nr:DNA primase [Ectothiorhodospiraceae bacterium]
MAGRIPQTFIDDLLGRVDIVAVIDERVPLKRAGREYKACCPFHGEKTPSFTVSPEKQFYHCFGCGAHGTALGFLMDWGQMEFVEAVEELARTVGLEVPREGGAAPRGGDDAPLYDAVGRAAAWFRRQLREHPQAERAVEYLKRRGLTGEVAARFGLGYAPPGWTNLRDALGTSEAELRLLERAGLIARRDDGSFYDRFRDRVVFPIQDRRGRTIAFGGRVLGDDIPKYLNSPETPIFHKGRELYGLAQVRAAGKVSRVVVVEGYMDVVALAQHGVDNAVATLGTAATADHLRALFRLCPDVVFCFDGDAAGRRAAWRALETALPLMQEGRQAFFAFLPDGEDPDSLVRARGREAFEGIVAAADSLGTFLFGHLAQQVDLETIDGRSRLAELARPLISRIPEGPFRELAVARLGQLTGIRTERWSGLAPEEKPPRPAARNGGTRFGPASVARSPVRKALGLLVQHPELATEVEDPARLAALDTPGAPLLAEVAALLAANPGLKPAAVVERFREHAHGPHLEKLLLVDLQLREGFDREFRDCLAAIERGARERDADRRLAELYAKAEGGLDRLSAEERRELATLLRRDGTRESRGESGPA